MPLLALALLLTQTAQKQGSEMGNDVAVAMTVAPGGDVFVTGYSKIGGSGYDFETIKYDSGGKLQWSQRYNGPANGDDRPAAIALDANENVYVTGSSAGIGSGSDYLTLKYSSGGQLQWAKRLDGAGNGSDHPTSMAVSPTGEVWVTGYSHGKDSGFDCVTVHYATDGTERWIQTYNGPTSGDDFGNAVKVDQNGICYVAGYSRRTRKESDYLLLAYDRDGHQKWVANYGSERKQDARAIALVVTSNGNICVTGYAAGAHADADIVTVDYDPTGKLAWIYRYDGPAHGQDKPTAILADPSNGSVVIGSSSGGAESGQDYATFCLGADGKLRWQSRYNGSESGDDIPTAATIAKDGAVYVTGYSQGQGSGSDFLTIAFDPSGKSLWNQRFNGVGNDVDRPIGIALNDLGDLYVAGYSWGGHGNNFDFVTLKYSAQGSLIWSRVFDGGVK
jgi:hypothetical protein